MILMLHIMSYVIAEKYISCMRMKKLSIIYITMYNFTIDLFGQYIKSPKQI